MDDRFNFRTPIYGADGKFKNFVYWNAESGFPAVTCREGDVFKSPEQCTGLKDKNGRIIYEGDVLKWQIYGIYENDIYTAKVSWIKGSFWLEGCNMRNSCFAYSFSSSGGFKNKEIVGNIHENPKLLEG